MTFFEDQCISGVTEIDIATTLEHLRDQRMGMVETKVSLIKQNCLVSII